MKIELISKEEHIDNDIVYNWFIIKNNGAITIHLNKIIEETISECSFIDKNNKYIEVLYSDWDSNELCAIVNADGEVIKTGIKSIEEFYEEYDLFRVILSGFAIASELIEFGLPSDDDYWAVIKWNGEYIINPNYGNIIYDEDDNYFIASSRGGNKYKYSINGERID